MALDGGYAKNPGIGIGPAWQDLCLECPLFTGLGQFNLGVPSLGKEAHCPRFQHWLGPFQELSKRRQRPGRDHIGLADEARNDGLPAAPRGPWPAAPVSREICAQEGAFAGIALDEMDLEPPLRAGDGEDQTRKSGAGTKVEPGLGVGREVEKLERIDDVPVPDLVSVAGPTRFLIACQRRSSRSSSSSFSNVSRETSGPDAVDHGGLVTTAAPRCGVPTGALCGHGPPEA